MNLLDDGEDEGGEIVESLKDNLEGLQYKKERLTWLEEEIEKKLAITVDAKNIEPFDGDASQEIRKKMLDGAEAGGTSSASTELLDGKFMQKLVDHSELFEDAPVISEAEGGGRMRPNLKLWNQNLLPLRRQVTWKMPLCLTK